MFIIELLEVPRIFSEIKKRTSAIVIPITPLSASIKQSTVVRLLITEISDIVIHVTINRIVPIVFFNGFRIYGEIVFPIILNSDTDIPHVMALPKDKISPVGIYFLNFPSSNASKSSSIIIGMLRSFALLSFEPGFEPRIR